MGGRGEGSRACVRDGLLLGHGLGLRSLCRQLAVRLQLRSLVARRGRRSNRCLVVEAVGSPKINFESQICGVGKEIHGNRKEGVFGVDLDSLEQLN